jgi:hypothetical protein
VGAARRLRVSGLVTALGAAILLGSLFLTWSHQITPAEHDIFHGAVMFGVPANPTAWQVYAIAGDVLAVAAIGIGAAGLWGQRRTRVLALGVVALGLAFVVHAAGTAPTNGLLLASGAGGSARYVTDPATAGPGETVALVGLLLSGAGLLLALDSTAAALI